MSLSQATTIYRPQNTSQNPVTDEGLTALSSPVSSLSVLFNTITQPVGGSTEMRNAY